MNLIKRILRHYLIAATSILLSKNPIKSYFATLSKDNLWHSTETKN